MSKCNNTIDEEYGDYFVFGKEQGIIDTFDASDLYDLTVFMKEHEGMRITEIIAHMRSNHNISQAGLKWKLVCLQILGITEKKDSRWYIKTNATTAPPPAAAT